MALHDRGSEVGFTLLELALSVALSAVLMTAFFSTARALMQGLIVAGEGVSGPTQAAEAMDLISADFEKATSFQSATNPFACSFVTPQGLIAYRLIALDAASQDVVLERSVNGATSSIGPRRMIANFNPYGTTFVINGAATTLQQPLFSYGGAGATLSPAMTIYLILQSNQTAPVHYLRTKAWNVTRSSW